MHHEDSTVDEILNREYGGKLPRPTLPPVSTKLASTVTSWLRVTPTSEKIKQMFQETLFPANIEGLEPVKINAMLYQSLPFRAKVADQHLRGINTYFTRGVGPLVTILDQLISLESRLTPDKVDSQVKIVDRKLVVDDLTIDVGFLRKLLDSSLKLLCAGNSVVLLKRRLGMKGFLDHQYHHLLKASNPITSELLGPNLDQKISEQNKISEVAKKLHLKRHGRGNQPRFSCSDAHRGRFHRGRGHADNRSPHYHSPSKKRGNPRDSRRQFRGRGRRN